jgi:signal transduction histidine kinase
LINASEHNNQQVYYHYFGKNDGMNITEMNGGCVPCALRLKSGTLSFPTMDGLLWVQPDKATPSLPSGEIYVDEIIVNNRLIDPDSIGKKDLSPKTSEIILKLGYSAWCNKENIYIDYQFSGDNSWKPLSINNEATLHFNNLPSGTYHLMLRKINGFGINNYSYKEVKFTIATPWYKQLWFAFVAAAAFLGFVLLIFQLRLRTHKRQQKKLELQVAEKTSQLLEKTEGLEKADRIKTRLISIISHDIITPLKFLAAAGKNLLEKRKQMPEELQQETIEEMTNTSLELQQLSTNILNWIKYQNENRRQVKEEFNLYELVDSVFSLLRSMATHKELVLVNKVPNNLLINQYYEPLKILVYNLVTNAINFSDKGTITVSLDKSGEKNILWVHDEGVGMTDEQIKNVLSKEFIISSTNVDNRKGNGLGYLIIKDLVKMMGATLDIKSEKGKGTRVSVFV